MNDINYNTWLKMENHLVTKWKYGESPFNMGNLPISMAMFASYFDITRGHV